MGKPKKAARKSEARAPEQAEAHAVQEVTAAEPAATTRKPKKEKAPKTAREERNGVKRPGPGKCLEVWEYLDANGDMQAKDLKPIAETKGWNRNNALIELYQWRKFNGVTRAATM